MKIFKSILHFALTVLQILGVIFAIVLLYNEELGYAFLLLLATFASLELSRHLSGRYDYRKHDNDYENYNK